MDNSIWIKTQRNLIQLRIYHTREATKLKKLPKVTACQIEMEQFKDSDAMQDISAITAYILKPSLCPIVMDEGSDVYCGTSGVIGPYGICCLWNQIKSGYALNLIPQQRKKIINLFIYFH